MTISSASLFRALTTSSINDLSRHQVIPDAELSVFYGLTTGIRSWYQTQHREHKKNEFLALSSSILEQFSKNENTVSITIRVGHKNLVISEYSGSVELVFGVKTNRFNDMTLKDFVVRLRLDRVVNAELYGILEERRERLDDAGLVLANAKLQNMNLSGADLSGTNLSGANLTGARLNGANLSRARLNYAYLCGTKLSGANLYGADLYGADLSGADLPGAVLSKAKLCWVHLSRARLTGADLFGASLGGANLSGAIMAKASLSRYRLVGADLKGVMLQDAIIDLDLPSYWSQAELDEHFNHIANRNSLLMTVESIDDSFFSLKIDLIHQMLQAINQPEVDLAPFYKNFYLLLNPRYYSDDTIKAFLTERVILPTIAQANSQAWAGVDQKTCEVLLAFVESKKDFDYIKNNGFFVQLILNSVASGHKDVISKAQALYNHYLSLESIRPVTKEYGFDRNAAGAIDLSDTDAHHYVLASGDQRILITAGNLTAMLNPPSTDTAMTWDNFYLFRAQANGGMKHAMPNNLAALFKAFTLFDQ